MIETTVISMIEDERRRNYLVSILIFTFEKKNVFILLKKKLNINFPNL